MIQSCVVKDIDKNLNLLSRVVTFAILLLFVCSYGFCQTNKIHFFDFNLVPGLGLSGIDHDQYRSYITLNLLSGYSDETLALQISGLSGSNRTYSGGLQIAGIVNFTGINLKSIDPEYEETVLPFVHMRGLQVSGLANVVRGDVAGSQATLIFNVSTKEMLGAQFAGISNYVGSYAFGAQFAGLVNNTLGSFSGAQFSVGFNKTGEELSGLQLGLINSAKNIEGPKSRLSDYRTGVQFGMLNFSTKMNGLQIGLINIAKRSQGTQVGLINVYPKRGKEKGSRDGTSVGLINIGDFTYFSVYLNELFLLNYELSTGNVKNGRLLEDTKNKYITNSISFSHFSTQRNSWAIGYGLDKLYFNRSTVPLMGELWFWGYGLGFQYVNSSKSEVNDAMSLLASLKLRYGRRLIFKLPGLYWFIELNAKSEFTENNESLSPYSFNGELSDNLNIYYWPGANFGLLLH